tara:strand:- start:364 stop:567 length:204 start_codon:yes stop_codon:yes gene_type:complete
MNEYKWNKLMALAIDLDAELASRLNANKQNLFPQEEGDVESEFDWTARKRASLVRIKELLRLKGVEA